MHGRGDRAPGYGLGWQLPAARDGTAVRRRRLPAGALPSLGRRAEVSAIVIAFLSVRHAGGTDRWQLDATVWW